MSFTDLIKYMKEQAFDAQNISDAINMILEEGNGCGVKYYTAEETIKYIKLMKKYDFLNDKIMEGIKNQKFINPTFHLYEPMMNKLKVLFEWDKPKFWEEFYGDIIICKSIGESFVDTYFQSEDIHKVIEDNRNCLLIDFIKERIKHCAKKIINGEWTIKKFTEKFGSFKV